MINRGVIDVQIKPGGSGQFDIFMLGELVYSRHATGRFPSDAEVDALVP